MIDIENDVFEVIASAVQNEYPDAVVEGEYNDSPAAFPAVTVVETDNRIFQRMRTDEIENGATVTYEVNVFSNRPAARKSEAKAIINLIDAVFTERGFTRMMKSQVPNLANAKIYRIVARYTAVVGPNGNNRFLIYQNN